MGLDSDTPKGMNDLCHKMSGINFVLAYLERKNKLICGVLI